MLDIRKREREGKFSATQNTAKGRDKNIIDKKMYKYDELAIIFPS